MENLTVLPYLRIYFRVLNAIEKSCFETLHTTSCVARTALDRLCLEVGRSSTLRRNMLLFMVLRTLLLKRLSVLSFFMSQ